MNTVAVILAAVALAVSGAALGVALTRHDSGATQPACTERSVYACPHEVSPASR